MMKLAVFDWNGTILADTKATVEGANRELAVINRPPVDLKQFRELYDIPLSIYYEKLGISKQEIERHADAMATAFHTYYEPRAAQAHTRPGARQLLDRLHARHIQRIVLSNHTVEGIFLQLTRLKLGHHFEAVLANETTGIAHRRGKQARLERYLVAKKILPSEAFIIGDTLEEIRIGRNVGLKTVAISGGHCSRSRLEAAKPDVLISNLHDLIDIIEEWL